VLQAPAEKDKFRDFIITSVLQDACRERLLWLTIWGDGLWKYDKVTGKTERFLPEPQFRFDAIHNVLHGVAQPDSNRLWLAAGELLSFDISGEKFSKLSSQHAALPLKVSLRQFHLDKAGNHWVSGSGGFVQISALRQQFGVHVVPKPLTIRAILDDPLAGKVYFGSIYHNRSLLILDKKTGHWETIPLPLLDKMFAGPVKFLKDRKGILWFLTNKGLFCFDPATHHFEEKQVVVGQGEKLGQRHCPRGEEDAAGDLWFLFDNGYLVKYTLANDIFSLEQQRVSTLGKGQNGKLLIVKHDGILLLHPQDSTVFYPLILPSKTVSSIAEDKRGNLWMGTYSDGIFSWNPGEGKPPRVRNLRMENGLPSNWIHQIACDPDGFIWASTRQGLVKIKPDDLSMNLFTKEDGLLTDDFDTELIFQPSGEVFLPLYTSLYHHFDFRKIRQPDLDSLPFHFHTFRIGGKPVFFEKNINYLPALSLHYPDNAFSVEFAALNFDGQKSIRYAFRLANLEDDWTDADDHRYAAFSHLPPGEYRLEVRMSNRIGFWSKNIRSLNVTVLPAWWQRTWVQVLAGLLLTGLISWVVARFYSLRLRQRIAELERQRELEGVRRRIAQDIHDEAGAGLTKIGLTAQVAAHLPPSEGNALKQKLDAILAETRNVSARLSEVLFAVNPRYDHFEAVQAWLREWCRRFVEDAGMEVDFDFPKSGHDPVLTPEVKRNLLLICKEALNNAVKYSGSERLRLSLYLDKNGRNYTLQVEDFGRGFSPEAVSPMSNGLVGMRRRAAQIGAEVKVKSITGEGTVLTVSGGL
jgi:signal transduction histidine kinase/streptogramin lyase